MNARRQWRFQVVSYRNSTSNHNYQTCGHRRQKVVSYRNSTSNHNSCCCFLDGGQVVSYRNSTSNHNSVAGKYTPLVLYLIEILHQTTTPVNLRDTSICCILSKFYIKPQLTELGHGKRAVVSYRNSTSNHNVGPHID